MPSSRQSSRSRDWTISCIAGRFFTTESPAKPYELANIPCLKTEGKFMETLRLFDQDSTTQFVDSGFVYWCVLTHQRYWRSSNSHSSYHVEWICWPMLNCNRRPKSQERQQLTDFRKQEGFIGSLASIQPNYALTVLWQDPQDGREKLAREALLAFLSGPGMLVGRGLVKMNSLISAAEIDK